MYDGVDTIIVIVIFSYYRNHSWWEQALGQSRTEDTEQYKP